MKPHDTPNTPNAPRALAAVGARPLMLLVGVLCCLPPHLAAAAEQAPAAPLPSPDAPPAAVVISLDEALQMAATHGERFLIASEQLERAKLLRNRAWAAFLPALTLQGTFTRADKTVGFSNRIIQRRDAMEGRASAVLSLFDGAAIPAIAYAYSVAEATEHGTRWQHDGLAFEVAEAYFASLASGNLVSATERSLRTAEEYLSAARARRAAGEAIGVDETRARIQVVSARSDRVRASNARDTTLDYLAFLVGRDPPIAVQRPADRVVAEPRSEQTALDEAMRRRADLRAADLWVDAARSAVTSAWMDFLPRLAVVGNYRATQNTGWSGDPDSWNVVLALEWVLLQGGLRHAVRREADSQLVEARLQRQLLVRGARRQVRQALRDVRTAHATLSTARERRKLAQQSQAMIMTRYRSGLATSLDVVEADDTLTHAEVSVVTDELGLVLAQMQLLRSLGLSPGRKEATATP